MGPCGERGIVIGQIVLFARFPTEFEDPLHRALYCRPVSVGGPIQRTYDGQF